MFESLIDSDQVKIYLSVKGFLPVLCDQINKEIESIRRKESTFATVTISSLKIHGMKDLSQGYVLKTLLDILASFLEIPSLREKFKKANLMEQILDWFLSLRGIIIQKTKLIDDSRYLRVDFM